MAASQQSVDQLWAAVQPRKRFFDAFRVGQYPTLYPAQHTPVEADILEAGLIFAAVILGFALLIVLPGIRRGGRLNTFIHIVVGVFVLVSILLCNFGQDWEVAEIQSKTQYRAGQRHSINASIGVKIGLRSINVTLKGLPVVQTLSGSLVNETIDYNERLSWASRGWEIGRGGFGPYAGRFNREFKEHQRKGSPYSVLWVAEYFTLDGEGARWGRFYLQAGYYTHIMLWTALPLWILSIILYKMVVRYGAYFSVLTGLCMLAGNAIYANVRNPFQLVIPFENDTLVFKWGPSFWLCVFTGLLCCLVGILIVIFDHFNPEMFAKFFAVDLLLTIDEYVVDENDEEIAGSYYVMHSTRKRTILLRRPPVAEVFSGATDESVSSHTSVQTGPNYVDLDELWTEPKGGPTKLDLQGKVLDEDKDSSGISSFDDSMSEARSSSTCRTISSVDSNSRVGSDDNTRSSRISWNSGWMELRNSDSSLHRGNARRTVFPTHGSSRKHNPGSAISKIRNSLKRKDIP